MPEANKEPRLEALAPPERRAGEETCAWPLSFYLDQQGVRRWDTRPLIRRMMEARGMTRAEAEARLAAQLPAEEKARRATWILQNDTDDPAALQAQVDALVAQWKQLLSRQ